MGSILQRILNIFRAKSLKALDRLEDPRDILDLSYDQQDEQLRKMGAAVADIATARKRIENQITGLQTNADNLEHQAETFMRKGREDLAREALQRQTVAQQQINDLGTQHQQVVDQETKMRNAYSTAQQRIEAFRTQKETLKATYGAAQAQAKMGEIASGINQDQRRIGAAQDRARSKIETMTARAGAIDELIADGVLTDGQDHLALEAAKIDGEGVVDDKMAALRAKIGDKAIEA